VQIIYITQSPLSATEIRALGDRRWFAVHLARNLAHPPVSGARKRKVALKRAAFNRGSA